MLSVQGLSSSHTTSVEPIHSPAAQASSVVQALSSSHSPDFGTSTHPIPLSQLASLHWESPSQVTGKPPRQAPPTQISPSVQGSPSLHAPLLGVNVQPVVLSHSSSVQGLSSSQTRSSPGVHAPPVQRSPSVQRLPSSHGCSAGTETHPVSDAQVSVVQGFPSLQSTSSPPRQRPPEHRSLLVQASPSSQRPWRGTFWGPRTGSQLSVVQGFPSSTTTREPTQFPLWHESDSVHASPSLQLPGEGIAPQSPVSLLHTSKVQGLPSSQSEPVPEVQSPFRQASPMVQTSPSSQKASAGINSQPDSGSQESTVHTFPSSQSRSTPTHSPRRQVSSSVQISLSEHSPLVGR